MSWIPLAFCGPLLWAISTHIDKYLVERFFKESDVAVLLVFTGLIGLVPLPFIAGFGLTTALPLSTISIIALSGALYMGAILLYLQALQTEEASVISPLFQTAPLFAYGLGYLALRETLTPRQLAGGALIMASMLVLGLQRRGRGPHLRLRVVLLMLGCAFALALTSVIFKLFAIEDAFWTTAFWMFVGQAVFGIAVLAVPDYRRQFLALFRGHPYAVAAINGANELINLGGGLAARYAIVLGPLSLVQAIGSTSPLFVFAIGVAITQVAPALGREDLSRANLVRKGGAAALVAAGVALITR